MTALIRQTPQEPLPESGDYREAPNNLEAEQALLGAILVNNEALDRVSSFLKPDHFFDPLHGRIFESAAKLIMGGKRATPITLKTFSSPTRKSAISLFHNIWDGWPNATTIINAEDYGRTVYDLAVRRQLIDIGEAMVNTAYDSPIDAEPSAQIEDAERRLYELAETGKYGAGFEPFSSALTDAIDMAANAYRRDAGLSGIATGFADLDQRMGGLQASDLVILAGRPSMGKTALATNIAYHVAKAHAADPQTGEMDGRRGGWLLLLGNVGGAARHPYHLEQSQISSEDPPRPDRLRTVDRIVEVSQELQNLPLFIDQTGGISVAQLAARARRLKRQAGSWIYRRRLSAALNGIVGVPKKAACRRVSKSPPG